MSLEKDKKINKKRIIIVYNPRSTQAGWIESDVIDPARRLKGYIVGKYAVQQKNVDENAKCLAKILMDGDIVISAGGDGTTTMTLNGVMNSKKDVSMAILPYGNFNDTSRAFGIRTLKQAINAKAMEVYPLDISVNDKHWRYVMSYMSVGMFAESVDVFEKENVRARLQKKRQENLYYSLFVLCKWWIKHRKKRFLAEFKLNGRKVEKGTTDYLAVNGKYLAKIMKNKDTYTNDKEFKSMVAELGGFFGIGMFMIKSMHGKMKLVQSEGDVLTFSKPAKVQIQTEGESMRLENVENLGVRKAKKSVKVIRG